MIPEALCGEAPKGQPMIRGETIEVVLWRPARSANEPQTPSEKTAQQSTRGREPENGEKTRPTIVTVEENRGKEKESSWGHSHETPR